MISWICFEWKTSELPITEGSIAPILHRPAEKDEEQTVGKTIFSAFALDAAWSDVGYALKKKIDANVEWAFGSSQPSCVVLLHGSRIIGASVIDLDPHAENNLLTGPCILHEYRNRGLGTCLLRASLAFLHEKDIEVARGITRANSIAARFIYPKFGSTMKPCSIDPLRLR